MTDSKDIINLNGNTYKKSAFMIEDEHPAIGRIIIVDDVKFKILDNPERGHERAGTYLARLTEEDEERMDEYDEALETLSEKLATKVDVKRLIKENIKNQSMQDIKTGLFILKQEEDGKNIEEEHIKGCYNYKMHYKNQCFSFMTGSDIEIR